MSATTTTTTTTTTTKDAREEEEMKQGAPVSPKKARSSSVTKAPPRKKATIKSLSDAEMEKTDYALERLNRASRRTRPDRRSRSADELDRKDDTMMRYELEILRMMGPPELTPQQPEVPIANEGGFYKTSARLEAKPFVEPSDPVSEFFRVVAGFCSPASQPPPADEAPVEPPADDSPVDRTEAVVEETSSASRGSSRCGCPLDTDSDAPACYE